MITYMSCNSGQRHHRAPDAGAVGGAVAGPLLQNTLPGRLLHLQHHILDCADDARGAALNSVVQGGLGSHSTRVQGRKLQWTFYMT